MNDRTVSLNSIEFPVKATKSSGHYYIDELGFYRLLDSDQRQYVCSNLNMGNLRAARLSSSSTDARLFRADEGSINYSDLDEQEFSHRGVRRALGISHFDKTSGYERWKIDWDEFMRAKLLKQEPVAMNRELKIRVRSGIPHDYRCKVWSALIRMRTRHLATKELYTDQVASTLVERLCQSNDTNHNEASNEVGMRDGSSSHISHGSLTLHSIASTKTIDSASNIGSSCGSSNKFDTNRLTLQVGTDNQEEKCFHQIELDLLRTLPNNRHFEDPNSRGIQRVRRVLRAYARFNPSVGYCQGMNRLAAMALLVLPEEEAFWCLVAIIQCIMPPDYYLKPWLAQVDCCVLAELLERKMPRLHRHLVRNDIQLTLFTWFFTIFVDGFRPELMLRIWDCFLLEGDKILFRFALAILHISQEELLQMQDFSSMSSHLSRLASTRRLDIERLFEGE